MKNLYLSGHGIKININQARLEIQDGRKSIDAEPEKYVLKPKSTDYDHIVVDGHSGYLSLESLKWLTKMNIQLSVLNWDGKLLTTILPLESVKTKLKFDQYRTYENPEERLSIAKNFLNAKFKNSKAVLTWLKEKYPQVSDNLEQESSKLPKARTVAESMIVEANVANFYWNQLSKIVDSGLEFESRKIGKTSRPMGSADPLNTLLNYGYSILESQCRKAVNIAGLDPHVGFLHEVTMGKLPLCYDFQEPFRSLVDVAVISGLEKNVFNKSDFVRTENYNLRLKPSGTKKLLQQLELVFNKRINYRGGLRTWSSVVVMKAQELAFYLEGKTRELDFSKPNLELKREDNYDLRQEILSIPYTKWKQHGFSKGTLHYMKQNAKSYKPFKIYPKVKRKLDAV